MNSALFLPLEVVKREYVGRVCLAAEVAFRGLPVFIGHKKWILRLALGADQPGIFFYKDAARDEAFAPKLVDKGFRLVVQDEEAGIIYNDYADFYGRRRSLDNIPNLHRFFCWGQDDYDFLTERFCAGNSCNILNTGSAKTALWGPYGSEYFADEIHHIRSRHEPFVLFVTNFGAGNSYLSETDLAELGQKHDSYQADRYQERYERESRLMHFAMESAGRISRETRYNVVIRPHPSENVDTWKELAKNTRGIDIQSDGDLTPWILASKCVLHNRSTAGIQAAASNVPAIAYGQTETDLQGVTSVPNNVSLPALGVSQVLEAIADLDSCWEREAGRIQRILSTKLRAPGTLAPLMDTTDEIMNLVDETAEGEYTITGRDSIWYDIKELYRKSRLRKQTRRTILDQSKRPTIGKKQLAGDVQKALKLLNHTLEVRIDRVGPNAYCVRRVA